MFFLPGCSAINLPYEPRRPVLDEPDPVEKPPLQEKPEEIQEIPKKQENNEEENTETSISCEISPCTGFHFKKPEYGFKFSQPKTDQRFALEMYFSKIPDGRSYITEKVAWAIYNKATPNSQLTKEFLEDVKKVNKITKEIQQRKRSKHQRDDDNSTDEQNRKRRRYSIQVDQQDDPDFQDNDQFAIHFFSGSYSLIFKPKDNISFSNNLSCFLLFS